MAVTVTFATWRNVVVEEAHWSNLTGESTQITPVVSSFCPSPLEQTQTHRNVLFKLDNPNMPVSLSLSLSRLDLVHKTLGRYSVKVIFG